MWNGESLVELTQGEHEYSWIVASHVIEHLPNPIAFLRDCEQLLCPRGVLSLVIPDKRFCFDHFRPLSTTGDMLNALYRGVRRPEPGSVFDEFVDASAIDGRIGWAAGEDGAPELLHDFAGAAERWRMASNSGQYFDVHVSRFVPESFRLIMQDLYQLGLTKLTVQREYYTSGPEFFVSLCSSELQHAVGRSRLLQDVHDALSTAQLTETGIALTRENESLRAERDRLRTELSGILRSRTWRAFAPWRSIRRRVAAAQSRHPPVHRLGERQ